MPEAALHPDIEATKDLVPLPDIDAELLPVLRSGPTTLLA